MTDNQEDKSVGYLLLLFEQNTNETSSGFRYIFTFILYMISSN